VTALPSRPKAAGPMSEPFDPYRKWLGIPPKDQPPHHYRLLGIATFEDDPDVIENAATRQMRHVRTFQTSKQHAPVSQRILTELSAAKVCLLTPESKAEYDQKLRARLAAAGQLSSTDLTAAVAEPVAEVPEPELPPLVVGSDLRWRTGDAGSRAGEPVPVPIPMPPVMSGTALAAPAFPAIRRTGVSASVVRPYRRQSALPIVLISGSILGLLVLGGLAFVLANRPTGDAVNIPKPKSSSANSEKPKPKSAATSAKPADLSPGGSGVTRFPVGIADSATVTGSGSTPFGASTPASASPPNSKPVSQADRDELTDQMRQAIFRSEQALKDRQDGEFRLQFKRAEQLVANESLPEQARFQEQVDDLRVLKQLNDEFWTAVRDNLFNKVEVGERIEFHQHKFELLSREGELVEYFLNGEKHAGEVRQLEPKAAILIASKTVNWEEPVTFLPIAAFLSVDSKVTDDAERQFGKQLFAIGRLIGKANPALARKYGLKDVNEEVKLDEELAGKVQPK
jgi:hypothetical protein